MVQVASPISTISNGWTVSPATAAHLAIDEGVRTNDGDTTYIQGIDPAVCHIGLSAISNPGPKTGFVIRLRYKQVGLATAGIPRRIIVGLTDQGSTTYTEIEFLLDHTGYETIVATVPEEVVAAITNWGSLGLKFRATGIQARITACDINAPDIVPSRVSRQTISVLGKKVPNVRVSRQTISVLGKHLPNHRVSRQTISVLGKKLPNLKVTRQTVSVLGRFIPDKVVPLPLPADLPPLFPANWIDAVTITTAWQTDSDTSPQSAAEERSILQGRPTRDISVKLTGTNRRLTHRLLMLLARRTHARTPFPLYNEARPVTASSSGQELFVDTSWRRFHPGGRVVTYEQAALTTEPKNVQYAQIEFVLADRLVLAAPLSPSVPAGAIVMPCIDAEISLSHQLPLVNDAISSLTIAANEVPGRSALPASNALLTPSGFPTHPSPVDGEALPILDVKPQWKDGLRTGFLRSGERYSSGRSAVVRVDGDRPKTLHDLRFAVCERAEFWRLLKLFDSRRGRARCWWAISPASFFAPVAITTTHVDVERDGNLADITTFVKHVGIVPVIGSPLVRGIASIVDTGSVFRITFDSAIASLTLDAIERVTIAHLARFDSDAMVENWLNDGVVTLDLTAIDPTREELSESTNALTASPIVSVPATQPDLYAWFVAGSNTFVADADPTKVSRQKHASPIPQTIGSWDDTRKSPSSPFLQAATDVPMHLVQFASATSNKGRPAVSPEGLEPNGFLLRETSSIESDPFWDNTSGLTIFVNCILFNNSEASDPETDFVRRAGIFEWEMGLPIPRVVVRMAETDGTFLSTRAVEVPNLDPRDGKRHTWCFVWSPSQFARLYRDGNLLGSATTPAASMPLGTRATTVWNWKSTLNPLTTPNKNLQQKRGAYFNELIIYKRFLSNAQLNAVGHHLESKYGLGNHQNSWVDIS